MADTTQKTGTIWPFSVKRAWATSPPGRLILVLSLTFCVPLDGAGADSYSTVVSNHLALEDRSGNWKHTPDDTAEDLQTRNLKLAVKLEAEMLPQGRQVAPPPPNSYSGMILAIVLPAGGFLALGALGYLARRWLDSVAAARRLTDQRLEVLLAEDPAVATFFHELRDALAAPAVDGAADANQLARPQSSESEPNAAPDPLREFFASVPGILASLRKMFSDISQAADEASRGKVLQDFLVQVSGLKDSSRPRELRPVWLMACALEGFLQQLSKHIREVTPSVLGTVAGAVDLLEALCVRGLNPNLVTEPPVRLLAVDDDPVSRLAVSYALKKAFNEPDLAADGEAALELIGRETYDVIFLDVDMPGMDGFELCTKIHQTANHQTTPVVFVTRYGDFNSRAKSAASGGEDLIAKPFLAFEITVKALTLALRGRLQGHQARRCAPSQMAAARTTTVAPEPVPSALSVTLRPAEASTTKITEPNGRESHSPAAGSGDLSTNGESSWGLCDRGFQALFKPQMDKPAETVINYALDRVGELRKQLLGLENAAKPAEIQQFLGQLYVSVHALSSEAEGMGLHAIARIGLALEGLLKRLLGNTKLFTASTLDAASAALELIEDLYRQTGVNPGPANRPVNILVVDDDPVARRGVSAAIQLAFGRPDDADSGEAALALAQKRSYDLIFLDVLMPGMDGFTTCKKIHETSRNHVTPVVFVTSSDDKEARSQAMAAGGCNFIPKPVLPSQISLTALTSILRARLERPEETPELEETAVMEMA